MPHLGPASTTYDYSVSFANVQTTALQIKVMAHLLSPGRQVRHQEEKLLLTRQARSHLKP